MRRLKKRNRNFGGIVVETLIVLVVIALLVIIAVPVYKDRDIKAKTDQASLEVEELAEAELAVTRDIGHFVPLQLLDDLGGTEAKARVDSLAAEPANIRLIPSNLTKESQPGDQQALNVEIFQNWKGPYSTSKRIHVPQAINQVDPSKLDAAAIQRDYPVDPWGNPYRFYSPIGVIGTNATQAEAVDTDQFSDGAVTQTDDRFDRYAIVSFGPDGLNDAVTEIDDDIIYLFPQASDE